jgi:putative thioredoxin
VRRLSGQDSERARAYLVELFELFSPDDPRVTSARRALARALF